MRASRGSAMKNAFTIPSLLLIHDPGLRMKMYLAPGTVTAAEDKFILGEQASCSAGPDTR